MGGVNVSYHIDFFFFYFLAKDFKTTFLAQLKDIQREYTAEQQALQKKVSELETINSKQAYRINILKRSLQEHMK